MSWSFFGALFGGGPKDGLVASQSTASPSGLTPRGLPVLTAELARAPKDGLCKLNRTLTKMCSFYPLLAYAESLTSGDSDPKNARKPKVLSTECWRGILALLSIDEVTRLWFTGSQEVHQALGRKGGVTSFEITAKNALVLFRFPLTLVSQFTSLQELVIVVKRPYYMENHLDLDKEAISRLPRGLEALILDFDDGLTLADFPPRLTRLHLPQNQFLSTLSLSCLPNTIFDLNLAANTQLDLSKLPPNLVRLKTVHFSLRSHSLPASLRCLVLTNDIEWYDYDVSALGPNHGLERLKLYAPPQNASFWAPTSVVFHATLIKLDLRSWNDYGDAFFGYLPRTMTTIRLGWNFNARDNFSDAFALQLPPDLTSLTLMPHNYKSLQRAHNSSHYLESSLTSAVFSQFPPGIRVVRIWLLRPIHTSHEPFYQSLPVLIHDINLSIIDWAYPSVRWLLNKFSKFVFRVGRNNAFYHHIGEGDLIPPVRKILINTTAVENTHGWLKASKVYDRSQWPSTVTSLSGSLPLPLTKRLPKNLTFLDLHTPPTNKTIGRLNDGLKTLRISACHSLTEDCIPALPHELTELSLFSCHKLSLSKFRLPESLRKLILEDLPELDFRTLPPLLTVFECLVWSFKEADIGLLPRTITDLKIRGQTFLQKSCFALLPPRLTCLELNRVSFDDQHLQNLPRSLRTFVAKIGFHDVTKEGIRQLPPFLQALSLPGDYFTDEMIGALPSSITQLYLPLAEYLTADCLDLLPSSILRLGLPAGKPYSRCSLTETMIRAKLPSIILLDPGDFYW